MWLVMGHSHQATVFTVGEITQLLHAVADFNSRSLRDRRELLRLRDTGGRARISVQDTGGGARRYDGGFDTDCGLTCFSSVARSSPAAATLAAAAASSALASAFCECSSSGRGTPQHWRLYINTFSQVLGPRLINRSSRLFLPHGMCTKALRALKEVEARRQSLPASQEPVTTVGAAAPVAAVELPAAVLDAPAAVLELSGAVLELPAAVLDAPAAVLELPAAVFDAPAAVLEPAAELETVEAATAAAAASAPHVQLPPSASLSRNHVFRCLAQSLTVSRAEVQTGQEHSSKLDGSMHAHLA